MICRVHSHKAICGCEFLCGSIDNIFPFEGGRGGGFLVYDIHLLQSIHNVLINVVAWFNVICISVAIMTWSQFPAT